jgi:hypothetical protein
MPAAVEHTEGKPRWCFLAAAGPATNWMKEAAGKQAQQRCFLAARHNGCRIYDDLDGGGKQAQQ